MKSKFYILATGIFLAANSCVFGDDCPKFTPEDITSALSQLKNSAIPGPNNTFWLVHSVHKWTDSPKILTISDPSLVENQTCEYIMSTANHSAIPLVLTKITPMEK